MRLLALLAAYFFLGLAILGIFLPGLPTVPFLLLSAWLAAKSSEKLHRWIYQHPQLGKLLTDWEKHGAISRKSKIIAVIMLMASWVLMFIRVDTPWVIGTATLCLMGIATFLLTRPEPA